MVAGGRLKNGGGWSGNRWSVKNYLEYFDLKGCSDSVVIEPVEILARIDDLPEFQLKKITKPIIRTT